MRHDEMRQKRQKTELISDLVDQNLEVLGPIQEGIQEAADSQVFSKGVELMRRANLETFLQQLKDSLLQSKRTTIEAVDSAQTSLAEAKEKYTLTPDDPSLWA